MTDRRKEEAERKLRDAERRVADLSQQNAEQREAMLTIAVEALK